MSSGRSDDHGIGLIKTMLANALKISPDNIFVVNEASDPIFHPLDDHNLTPALHHAGVPEYGRLILIYRWFRATKKQHQYDKVFPTWSLIIHSKTFTLFWSERYDKKRF